jgi:hypothetical protein
MKQFSCFSSLSFFLFVFLPVSLCADVFYVRATHTSDMNTPSAAPVLLQANDGLKIILPSDRTLLKAIELEIRIPPELTAYHDAFSYAFYSGVAPDEMSGEYTGTQTHNAPLPARAGLTLGIPYGKANTLQTNPYLTVVPVYADETTESVFFILQTVARRASAPMPRELPDVRFSVLVKLIFESKGFLELAVNYRRSDDSKSPYVVFIDERPISLGRGRIELSTGVHHLAVVSDFYRNVIKSFSIDQGKTSHLEIELVDIAPTLEIISPEHSEIYLDDAPVAASNVAITLTQGEHRVRVLLGGYELLRTINAENGKSYRISVFFDAEIEEIR